MTGVAMTADELELWNTFKANGEKLPNIPSQDLDCKTAAPQLETMEWEQAGGECQNYQCSFYSKRQVKQAYEKFKPTCENLTETPAELQSGNA